MVQEEREKSASPRPHHDANMTNKISGKILSDTGDFMLPDFLESTCELA